VYPNSKQAAKAKKKGSPADEESVHDG